MGFHSMPSVSTKELFIPVTVASEMSETSSFPTGRLNAAGEYARMAFHVPHDFTSITEAVVVGLSANAEPNADIDLYSTYAANGEPFNTHEENDTISTYNLTALQIFELDISGILSALAANDYVGITLILRTATIDIRIIGVRFKYS